MTATLLQSALVAAATAALVTYALEYAAKPWLEVRKARILDESAAWRSMQAAFKRFAIDRAVTRHPNLLETDTKLVVDGLRRCHESIQVIHDDLTLIRINRLPMVAIRLMASTLGTLDRVYVSAADLLETSGVEPSRVASVLEGLQVYEEPLRALSDYLVTPRWRVIARRRYRQAIDDCAAKDDVLAESAS